MVTLNPFKTLICHECKQGIKKEEIRPQHLHKYVTEGRDDEEEFLFHGIPIAGENKGDSEEDWYDEENRIEEKDDEQETDIEEEENNDLPLTRIVYTFDDGASADIAFRIGPQKDGRDCENEKGETYYPSPKSVSIT